MEMWKPIAEMGGKYEVSDNGRVRSVSRRINRRRPGFPFDTGYDMEGKLLTPHSDSYGYPQVVMSVDGKRTTRKVHRLVANAFIPNINELPEVNHLNLDKTNNYRHNLEWVSHARNMKHASENGAWN